MIESAEDVIYYLAEHPQGAPRETLKDSYLSGRLEFFLDNVNYVADLVSLFV